MIWLIIILAIVIVSFILALRSMKSYKEIPTTKYQYGLFLIKNESLIFENGILHKLYEFCAESNSIISLERLFNGDQKALVLYAPQNINQFVSELELLEIEDYLIKAPKSPHQKVLVNDAVVWTIKPKNEAELTLQPNFMKDLILDQNQNFFWQIVMTASKQNFNFQVNIRTMIVDPDTQKRIDLAKKINQYISDFSSLQKNPKASDSMSLLFDEYQKRIISPSEAENFVLSTQTIKQLL